MKVALINGSPKIKNSASACLLNDVKTFLEQDNNTIYEYHFRKTQLNTKEMEELTECNVLVFAFPLYVDGIPSHLSIGHGPKKNLGVELKKWQIT